MRFKTLLPWLLLAGVLGYVYLQKTEWHTPRSLETPTLSAERSTAPALSAPSVSAPTSYAAAVNAAAPAVVNIFTTQKVKQAPFMEDPFFRHFFGGNLPQSRQQSSLGSGVIVSPEGYVLTNNHVVERADEIVVALTDGRETKAKVIGTDPGTDLAIIKINLDKLPVLPFRESPMSVGDVVLAIGNPFGVGQTVTQGIISATGRQGLGINTFEDFLQTDAAINPGNSGGALVDVAGNLVGINTAIFSQSGGNMGIGFAIPASLARSVMHSIISDGKVVRGWLGIEIRSQDEVMAKLNHQKAEGVMVSGVVRGGPAFKAGISAGDKLMRVGNIAVESAAQATKLITAYKPGSEVAIVVQRGRDKPQEIEFTVTIGERPSEEATLPE
jgi:serine protease DegS